MWLYHLLGHDCWCEGAPLRDLFPSLYALAANKAATVALSMYLALGVWSSIFVRDALVDYATLVGLLIRLSGIPMGQSSLDSVTWDLNPTGSFTVKSQ